MEKYIKYVVTKILEDKFYFNIDFDIKKYETFLTDDRLKDIKIYSKYGLVSPQIYNICYLYLTKEKGFSKQGVKDCFIREVNKNKDQMQIIDVKRLTSKEYLSYSNSDIKQQERIKSQEESKTLEQKETLNNTQCITKQSNEDISQIEYTCENCMVMRKGDCIGEKKICSYFKYVRTITKEEINSWPDEMGYKDSYFYHR